MHCARTASLPLVCAICSTALAAVEVHTTTVRFQYTPSSGYTFTAAPVPMFDPLGGSRRLGLVRITYTEYWKATMSLDNPLSVQQCVDWQEGFVQAIVAPSRAEPLNIFADVGPTRHGRLGAAPFQQSSLTLDFHGTGSGYDYTMRGDWNYLLDLVGTELVTFQGVHFTGGFSTFMVNNPEPDCSGGFLGGGPIGFSTPLRMIESVVTYEYHWIPSSCPVDLTTLSTPGSQFYGQPDGIVDREDFFYFLDQLALANLAVADLTTNAIPTLPGFGVPNGVLNNDDFFYYLLKYAEGC